MPMYAGKNFIENEARYEDAIRMRIKANRAKTQRAKWLVMPGAQRLEDLFEGQGEFESTYDEAKRVWIDHPVVRAFHSDAFLGKMKATVGEWGGLTEGQHAAALNALARLEARVAERAKAIEEAKAKDAQTSGWVGEVGARQQVEFTLRFVKSFEGQYGISYVNVGADAAGNVIVYKGTKCLGERGATVIVKATIKEHSARDGVKQTIIARPA